MPTPREIVSLAGDEKITELKSAVADVMKEKINSLIDARRAEIAAEMMTKEAYEGNTPDEQKLLKRLLANISKVDYPVKNDGDLPFKAGNEVKNGPESAHAPAPALTLPGIPT